MNLPNKLSCFRILLVPLITILYLAPMYMGSFELVFNGVGATLYNKDLLILALFVIASFTDYLDGSIARKRGLITTFGKFIDPIADKLLVNSVFILLAVSGVISLIPVIIMIWRDMIVDGLRMNASSSGVVVAAGMAGKIKTVLQMAAIVVLLLNNVPFEFFHLPIADILLWGAMIVSLISGYRYFMQLKDIVMETM